jgi:hypothetical protein
MSYWEECESSEDHPRELNTGMCLLPGRTEGIESKSFESRDFHGFLFPKVGGTSGRGKC